MSSQYGELWPTNTWDRFGSLGHPSKFQRVSHLGFVTAATSFTGGQPNLLGRFLGRYTIYHTFSAAFAPWRNFAMCKVHFTYKSFVLLYWQHYCTALEQRASAKLCCLVQGMELRNFIMCWCAVKKLLTHSLYRRGRLLYSAGRPSRWASGHILVYTHLRSYCFLNICFNPLV